MSDESENLPVDATQFPEAAHKFARRALREHQRAEKNAINAVEHAVKSGQALLKAYDLIEYGKWSTFFEMHFKKDEFSLRTGQKYMQIARDWTTLIERNPAGFSSQRQALKALAAIVRADEPKAVEGTRAARGATERKRAAPVWKAPARLVREALEVIHSVEAPLREIVAYGSPLTAESEMVRAAFDRLRAMLETELVGAEAQGGAT